MAKDNKNTDIDKLFPVNNEEIQDVAGRLSSAYPPLDYALSGSYTNGGFPEGRIIEIFGQESTGKTMLATMACISNQKKGGMCIWLDFEHSFSLSYAKQLGLSSDPKLWRYMKPDVGEDAFQRLKDLTDFYINNNIQYSDVLVVIDSVPSIVTLEEDNLKHIEDATMRTNLALASFMSRNMKWMARSVNKTNMTVLFLNQTRDNPNPFSSDSDTPGGKALKFYASVRIKLMKRAKEKEGEDIVGENIEVEVIKNKTWKPFVKCNWITDFKYGINIERSILDFLINKNLIQYSGGWLNWDGEKYRKKELVQLMRENDEVKKKIMECFSEIENQKEGDI